MKHKLGDYLYKNGNIYKLVPQQMPILRVYKRKELKVDLIADGIGDRFSKRIKIEGGTADASITTS